MTEKNQNPKQKALCHLYTNDAACFPTIVSTLNVPEDCGHGWTRSPTE
jgi:hypothetical protein